MSHSEIIATALGALGCRPPAVDGVLNRVRAWSIRLAPARRSRAWRSA